MLVGKVHIVHNFFDDLFATIIDLFKGRRTFAVNLRLPILLFDIFLELFHALDQTTFEFAHTVNCVTFFYFVLATSLPLRHQSLFFRLHNFLDDSVEDVLHEPLRVQLISLCVVTWLRIEDVVAARYLLGLF